MFKMFLILFRSIFILRNFSLQNKHNSLTDLQKPHTIDLLAG